jgi:predicted dehydrogenase
MSSRSVPHPSQVTPISLALIGCGRLAEVGYAPALGAGHDFEVVAVVDPDPARRDLLAQVTGGKAFAAVESLLAAGAPAAAVVCGPADTHLHALEALSAADVRCLVEKPPAPDAAGARAIADLQPEVRVGFNRRFTHGVAALPAVPPEGRLAIELTIEYRRRSWAPVGDLGDAWGDLGPHLTDLALLLGGPGDARVLTAELSETVAHVTVVVPRGTAELHCATDARHRERVAIAVDGGKPRVLSASAGPIRGLVDRGLGRDHPLLASLRAQVAAFARECRGEPSAPLGTAADGVAAMELVDEARAEVGVPA